MRCAAQVADIFALLAGHFPGSVIRASTFDAYVAALLNDSAVFASLPAVTQEIGDTWVYGAVLPLFGTLTLLRGSHRAHLGPTRAHAHAC